MKLSNFFIKKKIQNLLNNTSERKPYFCSLRDAENVLVVFNSKDMEEALPCIEQLKTMGKNIQVCTYIPKKLSVQTDDSWFLLKEDDFDSKGIPTNEVCAKFTAVPADILIDLTRSKDYASLYMILQHPSPFKVGNKSPLRDMYDLTVNMGSDGSIKQLFEHILFYLQTIRSK